MMMLPHLAYKQFMKPSFIKMIKVNVQSFGEFISVDKLSLVWKIEDWSMLDNS